MIKAKFLLTVLMIFIMLPACAGRAAAQSNTLKLPKAFETYRGTMLSSLLPYVKIKGTIAETDLGLRASKFGGDPYFPKNRKYPLDETGHPMKLLAQINFAEMPETDEFPDSGILEFFVSIYDDVLGLDFDNPVSQKNFRVIYFPEISGDDSLLITDFSFITEPEDSWFPVSKTVKLEFIPGLEVVSYNDYRFANYFGADSYSFFERFCTGEDTVWEFYSETYSGAGHKMGGYAFFTQDDPRAYQNADYETLLLQIDSDESLGIMWGDVGVANFFIRPSDLKKRDFSKVMYNWDCY